MLRHAICLIVLVVIAQGMWGQVAQPPASSQGSAQAPAKRSLLDVAKTEDFRPLFQEREAVIDQMTGLDRTIDELSTTIKNLPPVSSLEKGILTAKRDLEKANKASPPDPARVELIQQYLEGAEKDLTELKSAGPKLDDARLARAAAARRLIDVENRIASLFDSSKDQNRFRSSVTYTFGVLVLIVIVGFYAIARQRDIATTIFAGEMGMQFVTLFLIVIAIILFGIMGTLEGKELAALLGGLSGYILGRTSQPKAAAAKETADSPSGDSKSG